VVLLQRFTLQEIENEYRFKLYRVPPRRRCVIAITIIVFIQCHDLQAFQGKQSYFALGWINNQSKNAVSKIKIHPKCLDGGGGGESTSGS
jgi:hypothetical protein